MSFSQSDMCCFGLQGIAAIHDAGWAHMDIKPDNLCAEVIAGQLHPYVVDFGSSLKQGVCKLLLPLAIHYA